jgi:hypothetical protein
MRTLFPCTACKRHIFDAEERCPFCGVALSGEARRRTSPGLSPDLSRAERYAIGAALVLTLAGAGCAKEESTPVSAEQASPASSDTAPSEAPSAEERPSPPPFAPRETRDDAPPSPFLVGSPAATPEPTVPPPVDAGRANPLAANAGPTATTKKITPPPPPPPPPDEDFLNPNWRNRPKCSRNAQGKLVCPPYGCVFPDEACDVLRV